MALAMVLHLAAGDERVSARLFVSLDVSRVCLRVRGRLVVGVADNLQHIVRQVDVPAFLKIAVATKELLAVVRVAVRNGIDDILGDVLVFARFACALATDVVIAVGEDGAVGGTAGYLYGVS
jgi:hypothetical protein